MILLTRDQDNIEKGREQGLQEGREQGLEEGREQGLKEGREQGEGRFPDLPTRPLQVNRQTDPAKSALDPEYRQKLYNNYHVL